MELINHEILPLEPEPTYYTIQVSFEDDSSQIIMEYEFSINFSDPWKLKNHSFPQFGDSRGSLFSGNNSWEYVEQD